MSLYLYAIVGSAPRGALGNGIARGPLRVARAAGTRVVVERAGAPPVTPATIRAHDRVVRRIARACSAVLPFRFGTVVPDAAALGALLAPIAGSIERGLELVRDCVQFTMRVYGHAAPPPKPRRGEGPGTRWLQRRLLAGQVREIAPVTSATSSLVRATRVHRHDRPPLLASVYHLVPRPFALRYRAAVSKAERDLDRVRIETTGPWPPYAFTELP